MRIIHPPVDRLSLLVSFLGWLGCSTAQADPIFVSVATGLSNISPGTSNEIVVGGNLKTDNKWGRRDGFGETGVTVLEAWDVEEDVPVLTMTLSGLTVGETYDVYVNYVRFTSNNNPRGGIRGSLDGSNFTLFNEPGGTPGAVGYAELTGFTNSDRVGLRGYLGTAVANASGEIAVHVDDDGFDGLITERVWFDGASYELAGPDTLAPAVAELAPANGARHAEAGADLRITFNEWVKAGSGEITLRLLSDDSEVETIPVGAGGVAIDGAVVTIDPAADLQLETGYYVEITDGAILDISGNPYPGFSGAATWSFTTAGPPPSNAIVEIAPDGAWTWFNDERAIFHQGYLFSGYVLSDGRYGVTRYDPATGAANHAIISTASSQQRDDHNNPSFTVLPDDRLLLVYSKHGSESKFYHRTSTVAAPAGIAEWNSEQSHPTPAGNTYANTYRLAGEADAIHCFHRSINWNPTVTISSDNGATWGTSTQVIRKAGGRPYVRYASNHSDRIDLLYTDGHPRDLNNSIYHLHYRDGSFRETDGSTVKAFVDLPLDHDLGERGTLVYPYSAAGWGAGEGPDDWIPGGRAWTWDIHYGADGHPVCAFQVQRDNVTGSGWDHDRIYYYYARWTGSGWQRRFIAHGGRGLYASEDDYGGGMAIDPDDPRVVYISSNAADPFHLDDIDDVPLAGDSRYEIWRGFTADGGLSFTWQAVTNGSASDNLRPIVSENHGRTDHVMWFQGSYSSYTSFSTRVVGEFGEEAETYAEWAAGFGLDAGSFTLDTDSDGLVGGLEYGFGGNPVSAGDAPRPVWGAGGIEFRIVPTRTDIEWVVESSLDLDAWTPAAILRAADLPTDVMSGFSLTRDAGDPDVVTVKPTGLPLPERLFLRVKVAQIQR